MTRTALVVGGGIAGMQTALNLANQGVKVTLVERTPSIGGLMPRLDKTFPTLDCAMCILGPVMIECSRHPNITLLTYSEIVGVRRSEGKFEVDVLRKPRYVLEEECNGCALCIQKCPISVPSEFNANLGERRAVYMPFPQAIPLMVTVDKRGVAPCRATCPAGVNAQGYIALLSKGMYKEALALEREENPLASVCGRVCTHPCEKECARTAHDGPVAIRSLKRFIADKEVAPEQVVLPPKRSERVAVVGAGPAGLTCAHRLARKGYGVKVFDSMDVPGGMLVAGIPRFRLPQSAIDSDLEYIRSWGVEFELGKTLGTDFTISGLFSEGYKAVFLALGAWKERRLGIEGEDLDGVLSCIDFLRKVNLGIGCETGKRVAVIGGGNAAIDAARTALRNGADEVTVVYRRSRKEMPANEDEVHEAEEEGVRMVYLSAPVKVMGRNGKVAAIECIRMELGEPDASGRRSPVPIAGSEHTMDVDTIIVAISQSPDMSGMKDGPELTKWGTVVVDRDTLQTSMPGVFAAGDLVSGPDTIIGAIAGGKEAADSIDRYINGVDLKEGRKKTPAMVKELPKPAEALPRTSMPALSPGSRRNTFDEVELGYGEEEALREAARCLSCAVCCECMECVKACDRKAFDHSQVERVETVEVGAVVLATGAEPFDPSAREEYGYGRYDNVYTSLQLERMLSASGPYMGKVKLSNGNAPRSVAFINCVGSRDHRVGQEYCSKICCMYGMKEALLVKEHEPGTDVTIFYMDIRASGKGYEEFYRKLRYEEKLVDFIRARPAEIIENADKTLTLRYEDTMEGRIREKTVDMVVLNMAMVPSKGTRELARLLGVETDKYGFVQVPDLGAEPLDSTGPAIYVGGMAAGPADITDSTCRGIAASSRAAGAVEGVRSFSVPPVYPELKTDEVRTGVFVCHCGKNIASVIDIEKMKEYSKTLPGVVHAEDNMFACSESGQTRICESIKEHGLTRVVVAACSPRTHEATFQDALMGAGLNPFLLDMANIRNHCSWVHPDKATALDKAEDLVRMSVARAANLSPLSRTTVGVTPVAVVVGGGIAGLAAAREFVENGFETHLIERKPYVGGSVAKFGIMYPQEEEATSILARITGELSSSSLFHLHASAKVETVGGYIGNFVLTAMSREYVSEKCNLCGECVKVCPVEVADDFDEGLAKRRAIYHRNAFPERYHIDVEACTRCGECVKVCRPGAIDLTPRNFDVEFGAMVVATGCEMGDREELERWGYGKSRAVLTTPELERLLCSSGPTGGRLDTIVESPKNIAVLLCADMRWGRNRHCSRYCCSIGLKSARELKKLYPDANVYVLYESIRTTWTHEILYEDVQKMGVGFIAYSFDDLPKVEVGDKLRLVVKEPLMNVKLGIPLDLLVLSVGGRPRGDSAELARTLRISCSQEGFLQEAHVKLAPVDTHNNGIFIAGAAQFPKDMTDAVTQGTAAAARAMNVISRQFIEVGGVVAHVDPDKCAACLTCVRNCPYDAIFINDEGVAEVNMAKCHSCGICTAECPAKAIVLRSFEDQQIIPMLDVFARGEADG